MSADEYAADTKETIFGLADDDFQVTRQHLAAAEHEEILDLVSRLAAQIGDEGEQS